ncbi:pentapeptide repeat-containing protein [Armatimonas sp.]|nr:pentapeptide repeat-containing protein [Armatimonas sp.]
MIDLPEAGLIESNLTKAVLTGANLTGILKDANTKGLPPGS